MSRRFSVISVSMIMVVAGMLVGCSSTPPPMPITPNDEMVAPPDPPGPAVAVAVDPSSLRPMAEHQRERLRELIDLAERRELREGGPRMLKAAKEQSRVLDRIEGRIDQVMRSGSGDSVEVDEIGDELRRFSTRLDLLADTLH